MGSTFHFAPNTLGFPQVHLFNPYNEGTNPSDQN